MSFIHKMDYSLKMGLDITLLIANIVKIIKGKGNMNPKTVLSPFNLN